MNPPEGKGWSDLSRTSRAVRRRLAQVPQRLAAAAPATAKGDAEPDPAAAPPPTVTDRESAAAPAVPPGLLDELNPLHGYESLLPAGPDRVVVVLADRTVRSRLIAWLAPFTEDLVHVIAPNPVPDWRLDTLGVAYHPGETLDELSWQTRLVGAPDVLVNLVPGSIDEHNTMWQRLFYYLKSGAAYVVDQEINPAGAFGAQLTRWLRYINAGSEPGADPAPSARQREFGASTAVVAASRDLVVIKKQQRHQVKLRETHASRLLALRDEGVTVTELDRLPAGDLESRARVTSHESSVPISALDQRLHHPALFLRHYAGRVGFAGSTLMFTDYTILPDSFRHHLKPNMDNPRIKNLSVTFARVPRELLPTETLPGHYYQLDSSFSGHFGHVTTEVLGKLWGWDRAKREFGDLKALFSLKSPHAREPTLERRLFTAYGIEESDIVWVDRPVNLESVVSATPMWHNAEPHYVHPGMTEVWDRLGESLIDWSVPARDRIFISRASRTERRLCRNADQVEEFFAARGYAVIYPEQLDLSVQAGIFAQARVVAGFGGSAMFNLMYAKKLQNVIVLSHEAYTARNEHLFTSLLGADVDYFWSSPDIPHPDGGWTQEAFYSDWEFDFARNEAPLDALITSLQGA